MNLQENLKKYNFKFKKKFGQNFIGDINLLSDIASEAKIDNENILEIGPGAGTLTEEIAKRCKKILSVEIDKDLEPILNKLSLKYKNLKIQFDDILKIDENDIYAYLGTDFHMLANIPYYITSPIMMWALNLQNPPKTITLMMQEEVARRFAAKEGGKDYGIITVILSMYGKAYIQKYVSRDMFVPAPDVDSAILRFKFDKIDIDENLFNKTIELVKIAFSQRRKTIVNNLLQDKSLSREQIETCITKIGKDIKDRAETFSRDNFISLCKLLYNM